MSSIAEDIQIDALKRESAKRKKKAKAIQIKIEAACSWGSDLVKAHNEFAKKFNEHQDARERLTIIDEFEKERANLIKISDYDINELTDELVRLESEAFEIDAEVAGMEYRRRGGER